MNAPNFPLMKRSQIVSFFHLQMPRWLFAEQKYSGLSVYAKVAYTFLLNRYQLSQRNGWVSEQDEVYIIFTREELAAEMQVSYKRAIASFKELQDANLIWEQRRGRGLPNHIYLADVEHETPQTYQSAPFCDEPARPAEMEGLEEGEVDAEDEFPAEIPSESADLPQNGTAAPAQDLPKVDVLNCQYGISRPAETAHQDLPKSHPSNTYRKNIYRSDTENQSVRMSDEACLKLIFDGCYFSDFDEDDQQLMCSCISWLYYADEVRIGKCCYPQDYVRSRLYEIDDEIVREALHRIHQNQAGIRKNTLVYVAKVLFSCLMEHQSWMALDPYLNSLRGGGSS